MHRTQSEPRRSLLRARPRALRLTLASLLLLVIAPGAARGTEALALDEAALVARSEAIVHGRVRTRRCQRLPDGRIYTEYGIEILEALKGPGRAGATITFREWGGEVDGVHYWIPGAGRLEIGEEAIVFLGPRDPRTGVGFTTGLAQGKWHVVRPRGSTPQVVRRLGPLVLREPDGTRRLGGAQPAAPLGLEEALARIRLRVRALRRR